MSSERKGIIMNTVTKETTRLEDKIYELVSLADQIGAIAICATSTNVPEHLSEATHANIMYSIKNLSEMLSDRLAALSDEIGEAETYQSEIAALCDKLPMTIQRDAMREFVSDVVTGKLALKGVTV